MKYDTKPDIPVFQIERITVPKDHLPLYHILSSVLTEIEEEYYLSLELLARHPIWLRERLYECLQDAVAEFESDED